MAKNNAAKAVAPGKDLTVVERAVIALGYTDQTTKDLTALALESTHITAITNKAGYDQCHAARMVLKNMRLEIADRGKTAREDAQTFSKAVIAEEKRLLGLITPEEDRLEVLQDEHDEKIEREKREAAEAEERRVTGHRMHIQTIRESINIPFGATASSIAREIATLEATVIDESFEEYEDQARDAKVAAITVLGSMRETAAAREAAEEEARKNREELERLRAENAERDRLAKASAPLPTPVPTPAQTVDPPLFVVQPFTRAETTIERIPAAVTNIENVGLITHICDERPSFEDIARAVAFTFETDEDTVRTWICETVTLETQRVA